MPFVILDRDGVINVESKNYIKSPDEWEAIPGSLEAIARLHRAGIRVVIATNQSGIERGLFDISTLNRIHKKMIRQARDWGGKIDAIFFCPHAPETRCDCRKPKPGLLLEASGRLDEPLSDTPFVGDSVSDITAARSAGARPILVKTGSGLSTYTELMRNKYEALDEADIFDNLLSFVDSFIISEYKN